MVAMLSSTSSCEKLDGHGYEKEDLADKPLGQFSPTPEKAHKNEVKASHIAGQPKISAGKVAAEGKPNPPPQTGPPCNAYQHSVSFSVKLFANSISTHLVTCFDSPATL